jgi:hypothetical protein
MPGSGRLIFPRGQKRGSWIEQPFNYVKACRFVETVLLVVTAITISVSDLGSRYSYVIITICVAAEIIVVMLILERLVWKLLPPSVRARIPYDVGEALQQKGDVRSYRDLPKLRRTNDSH